MTVEAIDTHHVAFSIAQRMRAPGIRAELLFHPGDLHPSGVILSYQATRQVFICLVSRPQSPQEAREFVPLVPLPFPED